MEISSASLKSRFQAYELLRSAMEEQSGQDALLLYLEHFEELTNRTSIEWKLAGKLLQRKDITSCPDAWPSSLLNRPSGASLAFVAAQLARKDIGLPSVLARFGHVPPGGRLLMAQAWMERPDTACLRDSAFRRKFALWLAREDAALGPCLVAAGVVARDFNR